MKVVHFLYHLRDEDTDDEDIKLIGVYTDRHLAVKAKERVLINRDSPTILADLG